MPQCSDLAEINIDEILRIHLSRDPILDLDFVLLHLERAEYTVPDIKKIAEVCIHIQWISCVMNAVVRRS